MITDAFKYKTFPMVPIGFNEDEMSSEYVPSENEQSSESEDITPDISTSEQITMLEKFYGADLINK